MRELAQDVVTLSELIRNVIPIYDIANPHQKERIVRVIFSELFISRNTMEYKVKKGFEPFTDRISALDDPIAWLSELETKRECLKSRIRDLENKDYL